MGNRINSLLWNFVEYRDETTGEPTYYYELYNPYSDKYLAPQLTGNQLVSPNTLGINLNGRRNGYYYTSILGWDTAAYQYAGLKVEDGRIVPCPIGDAEDFYFAIMQDLQVDDQLTEVPTVDHTQYGITMKVIDFRSRDELSDFLGSDDGGAVYYTVPNLLSNSLGADGYPMAHGGSLGTLFAGAREVNHLFIASTYSGSGYYEFDSTQNFASLQSNNNFKVYKELGTYDSGGNKPTLKHGQFFPFNDLKAGLFASVNGKNQYTATASPLPANDPRRDERLYLIQNVNTQFGVEIEATFTQTPNGLDAWGHDIIYQFTGDDDFWLYVNGELVIDLGGIHSALPGSVNFSTGDVYVNGVHSTLKDIYYNNAIARGESASDAQAYVDDLFVQNSEGNWIFKEYSTNTMRLFFMERGAGASNLYMRFNLASVKPGTVELSKELSGVDDSESVLAQFPYQVWYTTDEHPEGLLLADTNKVTFKDTITRVPYKPTIEIDGHTYDSVFLLRPGEIATIELPEDTVNYKIVECGVNEHVYSNVYVNGAEVTGQGTDGRKDYAIPYASTASRARVAYVNAVNPDALRTLSITKELFNESGETELRTDNATFNFRLYFGTEFDSTLTLANMYTYHVKDQNGNYCTWNASLGRFESTGVGNYGDLTDTQKAAASFTTSMNGSVGSIPPFYTVEVRELLAGTNYKVEERANEIPDGYSLQKYVHNDVDCGETPPQGEIVIGQDADVAVRNLRGWGLRVYKQWSDQDYMAARDDAYFAVFTRENDTLNLVEGSMRRLRMNESTLYWYFQRLKENVAFTDYQIREVTPVNPETDADGVVTADSYTILEDTDEIEINGRQKGESESSLFRYTVLYTQGEIQNDSNVRVDTITNNRPGIELRKQLWNGTPLPGAAFTLHDSDGNLIGSFTSDSTGLITVAFLRDDVDYTLTETATPQTIHGLEAPMTIRLSGGAVTVTGVDAENYILNQGAGQTPTLIIRNRPFTLTALKQGVRHDGTTELLAGVHFALHREVTIGGIVTMDFNPMPGYEDLVTDSGGVIPLVTQSLPVGSYYLKETSQPEGYESISAPIRFTISASGALTLSRTQSAELQTTIAADGTLQYTLVVKNIQVLPAPTGITAFLQPFAMLFAFGLGLALMQLFRRRRQGLAAGASAEADALHAQTPPGTEGPPGDTQTSAPPGAE